MDEQLKEHSRLIDRRMEEQSKAMTKRFEESDKKFEELMKMMHDLTIQRASAENSSRNDVHESKFHIMEVITRIAVLDTRLNLLSLNLMAVVQEIGLRNVSNILRCAKYLRIKKLT